MEDWVPFNKPFSTGRELEFIQSALKRGHISGDGHYTRRCAAWLEETLEAEKVLITHSCTAALEMSALLLDIEAGDEVVMPSYTFVSTANAFVLRGAVPVFVDVTEDTLTLDPDAVRQAIGTRTKAIVPVHYAGVACDMDVLQGIADDHGLAVVEDAAQGLMAKYRGRPLGSIGELGTISFHETKNIISGEGGALVINQSSFAERAEIIWEKGTNRRQFFRGEVEKYSWVDLGSSYLPSDMIAAFLWAQLLDAEMITAKRLSIWKAYHAAFEPLETAGLLRRPVVPPDREHNAHLYYIILPSADDQARTLQGLDAKGVNAIFHYVPLHSSVAGRRFSRTSGSLSVTEDISRRLIRLPLWPGMTDAVVDRVIESVADTVVHDVDGKHRRRGRGSLRTVA